jgi:hypothetical protein
MSIALYHVDPETLAPAVQFFGFTELTAVLAEAERLRHAGMRHVSISTENPESVGKPGVNDKLPEGYDWHKRHRGAGPGRS